MRPLLRNKNTTLSKYYGTWSSPPFKNNETNENNAVAIKLPWLNRHNSLEIVEHFDKHGIVEVRYFQISSIERYQFRAFEHKQNEPTR